MSEEARADSHFESLYREYYGRVLAYALRRATPDIAHDVVADTFLVAWRRRESLPDQPLPWLLGVARKTLANQWRSMRRRQSLLIELKAEQVGRPNPSSGSTVAALDVMAALDRLSESDQELLRLIAWEELTPAEAAKVLGQSAATCRVRLHVGRQEQDRPARR
jgi:RNA polymerase sigma-70 factor, ECF subfamily